MYLLFPSLFYRWVLYFVLSRIHKSMVYLAKNLVLHSKFVAPADWYFQELKVYKQCNLKVLSQISKINMCIAMVVFEMDNGC